MTSDHPGDAVGRWLTVVQTLNAGVLPPPAGATADQLRELEGRLGVALDDTHRRLLLAQDGWQPTGRTAVLAGGVHFADLEWLGRAPRTFSGPTLEDITGPVTARSLLAAGISPGGYLVVAVDSWFGASSLMPIRDGQVGPGVVTVAGWAEQDTFVGTIYPSFSDFLDAMAAQVDKNAGRVRAREAKEARARQRWYAEPAVVIRGLPDSSPVLAAAVTALMAQLSTGDWQIATRRWDGTARGLERLMIEAARVLAKGTREVFLSASLETTSGSTWQVSVTRSWPSAPTDHVLVLLRSAGAGEQPTPAAVELLIEQAAELFRPTSITASSTAANRAATEAGIPPPTGYRVWLRDDQLGPAAFRAATGDFTMRTVGQGVLLSGPDDGDPEVVVRQTQALISTLVGNG